MQLAPSGAHAAEIVIPVGSDSTGGTLVLPPGSDGIVLFAHGSGSSRHSPRNQVVAAALHRRGLATLLMDLLTPAEEQAEVATRHLRFNIDLLAERLAGALKWLAGRAEVSHLPVGLFGASTGAAAALVAAARAPQTVKAVVSRGGRPDLAGEHLARVQAPTLLIVGSLDPEVLDLNRDALARLHCEKHLEIVAGASHLFEERGTLDEVAALAGDWLSRWLSHREGAGQP